MPAPRRVDAIRAFYAGQAARAQGDAITACPHNETSTDRITRVRLLAWIRGWRTPIAQ